MHDGVDLRLAGLVLRRPRVGPRELVLDRGERRLGLLDRLFELGLLALGVLRGYFPWRVSPRSRRLAGARSGCKRLSTDTRTYWRRLCGQYSIDVEGFLAIENGAAPDLVIEASHSVRDVYAVVRQAPSQSPVQVRLNQNGTAYCRTAEHFKILRQSSKAASASSLISGIA